ncbi:MAG: efflux RND transporter periplasmic adaptor subunit [Planctomycetes bacterium]|nr:efflux RND transporter periplasmic adaptor subunit [Planctomycetota bacterium]
MAKNIKQRSKIGRILIPLALILVLTGGGFGYYYWNQGSTKANAAAATPSYKTAQVKRGNIIISASGTGSVVAMQQVNLGFSTSGTVASANVQVGDQVKEGQVLAVLTGLDVLQGNVNSAKLDLATAQQALATLQQNAPFNLANAQIALTNAQKAYTNAQSAVVTKGMPRCNSDTTAVDYQNYLNAKKALDSLGNANNDPTSIDYITFIAPAKLKVAQTYGIYMWCLGYTDYEINSSSGTLALTKAQLQQAQTNLDALQKNNGLDPLALAQAENAVSTAQMALTKAQQTLDGATLKAPFAGVVMSIAGQAGDTAGTGTFITIADLAHPQVSFYIDETDMDKLAIGEETQVVFDAIPNKTFTGKVVRIYPNLVTVSNYQAIQALAQLDLSAEATPPTLPVGLNGSVDVIGAKAENVLLVPVEALRDLGNGSYSVFVVKNGQPQLKVVTVGLMDAANAEIKTGVNLGDVVTTGILGTKQ